MKIISCKTFLNYDFIKYKDDPFIPKSIAKLLENIDFKCDNKLDRLTENLICIGDIMNLAVSSSPDHDHYILSTDTIKTFKDLILNLTAIKRSIIKWLNNPKVSLNLK